jgi:hypothetical protein
MNRLNRRSTSRHLSPRLTVTGGAALGLVAGVAIYGALSSSAEATKPAIATVAKPPVAAAHARFANCSAATKLEKGVCIVHVVRKVVVTPASTGVSGARARGAGAIAGSPSNRAGVARPGTAATPGSSAPGGNAPDPSGSPAVAGEDGEGASAASAPALSPKDSATRGAKEAAPRADG